MACLQCGDYAKNKFCSHSCAAKYNNVRKKPKLEKEEFCLWCGGDIGKNATKFCSRECKPEYALHVFLNKWRLGLFNSSDPASIPTIRRYLKHKYGNKCSRCSWHEANPYNNVIYLEIEHIDGDSDNNDENNLDLICPNCHSLTSTYKALNKGNGRKSLKLKRLQ